MLRFTDIELHAYGLHWDGDADLSAFVRKLGKRHPDTVVFLTQTSSRSLAMMSDVAAVAWKAETGRGLPAVVSYTATSPQLRCAVRAGMAAHTHTPHRGLTGTRMPQQPNRVPVLPAHRGK